MIGPQYLFTMEPLFKSEKMNSPTLNKKKVALISLSVLVLIGAIIGLILYLRSGSESPKTENASENSVQTNVKIKKNEPSTKSEESEESIQQAGNQEDNKEAKDCKELLQTIKKLEVKVDMDSEAMEEAMNEHKAELGIPSEYVFFQCHTTKYIEKAKNLEEVKKLLDFSYLRLLHLLNSEGSFSGYGLEDEYKSCCLCLARAFEFDLNIPGISVFEKRLDKPLASVALKSIVEYLPGASTAVESYLNNLETLNNIVTKAAQQKNMPKTLKTVKEAVLKPSEFNEIVKSVTNIRKPSKANIIFKKSNC